MSSLKLLLSHSPFCGFQTAHPQASWPWTSLGRGRKRTQENAPSHQSCILVRRLIPVSFPSNDVSPSRAESVKMMTHAIYDAAARVGTYHALYCLIYTFLQLQTRLTNDLFNNDGAVTVNILDYSSAAT